jgi:hypothetical protein
MPRNGSTTVPWRRTLTSLALAATVGAGASALPAVADQPAARDIPISPAGYLGQFNLSSNSYVMGFRFVFDTERTIDRWYFAINGEGADCVGGREGYGSGDGGMFNGRIVEVDPADGLPTGTVLAGEQVNGCESYERARAEFGLEDHHQSQFVQFDAVTLRPNTMYAFLLSNTDPDPGDGGSQGGGNHMSPNLNFAKLTEMGPTGTNNLDPSAPGATFGLDPRETTMWSDDDGSSWRFGDQVGWYDEGNGEGRMWTVGYREAGGDSYAHGWGYLNWPDDEAGSVTYRDVPKDVTLTHAGGASEGGDVGVVTVTNESTGVSASTADLGGGLVSGELSHPVPVKAGESYTVENSGVVDSGAGGAGHEETFGLGARLPWLVTQNAGSNDMPMLYAAPHPYYG